MDVGFGRGASISFKYKDNPKITFEWITHLPIVVFIRVGQIYDQTQIRHLPHKIIYCVCSEEEWKNVFNIIS